MTLSKTVRLMVVGPEPGVIKVPQAPRDYHEYNRLVGGPKGPGSISMLRLPQELQRKGFRAYCDDDAISREQEINAYATNLGHFVLRGPIVIFRDTGDGEEHSLRPTEAKFLAEYLSGEPTVEAYEDALQDQAFWAMHPSGIAIRTLDLD